MLSQILNAIKWVPSKLQLRSGISNFGQISEIPIMISKPSYSLHLEKKTLKKWRSNLVYKFLFLNKQNRRIYSHVVINSEK